MFLRDGRWLTRALALLRSATQSNRQSKVL
jgi:hypothetical protein